jgi:toxin ParE1/3/4
MVKIVWSEQAIQDLNDIGNYIAIDSERYAREMVRFLYESVIVLESHPKSGRIVPEYKLPAIRELIRRSYRIVYRIVDRKRVDILTVHHTSRLLRISRSSDKIK